MTLYSAPKSDANLTTIPEGILPGAKRWLPVALILAACITLATAAEWDGLVNLYKRWMYEEEYDYGILVAPLALVFLWGRRHQILELAAPPRWPGFLLVALAQVCAIFGNLGESYFIQQIAFIFTLLGFLIVVFGTRPFRIFAPLTILLLLTVPLPYTLQAMLTVKLQLLSTDIGAAIIRFLGIPIFVEGNIVDLGLYKLQVAEACSGLRYLLPLTCIAFVFAYLYKASWWKRVLLVVSAVPLTILVNSFRIAVTAILVNNFGTEMAEGFFHLFEGWIVFCLAVVLLGIVMLALEKFRVSRVVIEPVFQGRSTAPAKLGQAMPPRAVVAVTILVCVVTLGVAGMIEASRNSVLKPNRESFTFFPQQINNWIGRQSQLDATTLNVLKATDYYVGDFSKERLPAINLFIAYYDSLARGEAIHSPRVCLPGSGWEFATFEEKPFSSMLPGVNGTFNRVIIQKGTEKMLMYYWFQQRERRTANEFSMKYYLLADSLRKSRKDGALVRVVTPIQNGTEKGESEADDRLKAFMEDLAPKLDAYLPT